MSDVKLLPMATNLSLSEGEVGVGTFDITCPGIIQCFAVVGVRGSALIGTHITPGTNQQQMQDTFGYLKSIGGDSVGHWYILGPSATHFSYSHVWQSIKDIKKTFKNSFSGKSTTISILDSTDELSTKIVDPRYPTLKVTAKALDIRGQIMGIGTRFHYRFRASVTTHLNEWHEFDLRKFRRI